MFYKGGVFLLFLGLFSCSDNVVEQDETGNEMTEEKVEKLEIKDLKWLEGIWVDKSTFSLRNITYVEEWVYYSDSLSGKGLSVENGDTTQTEQLAIRIIDNRLMYVARPFEQPVIGFPAIKESKEEVVFQNNAHDFPQKINYQKKGADSLIIDLSGFVLPQGDKKMQFKLRKL